MVTVVFAFSQLEDLFLSKIFEVTFARNLLVYPKLSLAIHWRRAYPSLRTTAMRLLQNRKAIDCYILLLDSFSLRRAGGTILPPHSDQSCPSLFFNQTSVLGSLSICRLHIICSVLASFLQSNALLPPTLLGGGLCHTKMKASQSEPCLRTQQENLQACSSTITLSC